MMFVVAPCVHCGKQPSAQRSEFFKHIIEVQCFDCIDADYDYDAGRYVQTTRVGQGRTVLDALDDWTQLMYEEGA